MNEIRQQIEKLRSKLHSQILSDLEKGMTQSEVARKYKVSRQWINLVDKKRRLK